MDYRVQRLKEDLTNAQQRNKKQRIQLANYKKVHERDLETIKQYKEVIDKAIKYINVVAMKTEKPKYFMKLKDTIWGEELLDILKEVE